MDLLWPANLAFLLVVAALALVYVLAQRRRRRYALRYASIAMVREAVGRGPGIRRHIPAVLFLIGLTVLVVALARPALIVKVPGLEGTVILAIDTSGSMLADDVKPNRLEAAKEAAKTFVVRQRASGSNIRVGVVSFSDNAELVMAPTLDREGLISAIDRLRPKRATALGQAIQVSLRALYDDQGRYPASMQHDQAGGPGGTPGRSTQTAQSGDFASTAIVLLTDGENNQSPPPLTVLDDAVALGIRVYTVGIGTAEGAVVTNEGRSARSELDEKTLVKLSEATQAKYFNAQSETDLTNIYSGLATQLVLRDERSEVTALFAGGAAFVLILAAAFSLLIFERIP